MDGNHGGIRGKLRLPALCLLVIVAFLGTWYATHRSSEPRAAFLPEVHGPQQGIRIGAQSDPGGPDVAQPEHAPAPAVTEKPAELTAAPEPMPVEAPEPSPAQVAEPTGTITGTVLINGKPARGYRVAGVMDDTQHTAQMDSAGRYILEDVPAGNVSVDLYRLNSEEELLVASKRVQITAGETLNVDFDRAEGNGRLSGLVTKNGEPLANLLLTLALKSGDQDTRRASAQTDAQGAYVFDHLPAGTAYIKVNRHTSRFEEPIFEAEIAEDADTRLDIDLAATARVEGVVSGNPKGWQLMGALVRGSVPMPQPDLASLQRAIHDRMVVGGTMNEDGVYDLEEIPPGKYTSIVWSTAPNGEEDGFKQAAGEVIVKENDEIVRSDLTLE